MMGERQVDQGALFYEFSLEKQVPTDHMLRSIDRCVDLGPVRTHLVHRHNRKSPIWIEDMIVCRDAQGDRGRGWRR
jgi:hypothetical protein